MENRVNPSAASVAGGGHNLKEEPRKEIKNTKFAFTLAETMIVLAIMGVIASLTLPALLRRQTEQANRTRIRKAMKAYDTAIQKMVIENNIKTDGAFDNWAADDCSNTASYFKISENGDNGCTFKTSDGVWWDISDIKKPIVAVRSEKLTDEVARDENDNDAFYFITTFDPNARAFRTDDYAFETGDNKVALKKLYNFVKPEVGDANANANQCSCEGYGCCDSNCVGEDICVETGLTCRSLQTNRASFTPDANCTSKRYIMNSIGGSKLSYQVDEIQDHMVLIEGNDGAFYFFTRNEDGSVTRWRDTPGSGSYINGITFDKNGDVIAYHNYDRPDCTRDNCTWEVNPFDYGVRYHAAIKRADGGYCDSYCGSDAIIDKQDDKSEYWKFAGDLTEKFLKKQLL